MEQHADATLASPSPSSSSSSSSSGTSARKVALVAFVDLSADHMGAPCALVHVGGTGDSFAEPPRSSPGGSSIDRSIPSILGDGIGLEGGGGREIGIFE